jgi:hypothetical protein
MKESIINDDGNGADKHFTDSSGNQRRRLQVQGSLAALTVHALCS